MSASLSLAPFAGLTYADLTPAAHAHSAHTARGSAGGRRHSHSTSCSRAHARHRHRRHHIVIHGHDVEWRVSVPFEDGAGWVSFEGNLGTRASDVMGEISSNS